MTAGLAFSDLHFACCRGCDDNVIEFLCDIEGIEERTLNDDTPLLLAAYHDHSETVSKLLRLGANVCAANKDGMTALMIACLNDNPDMIVEILRYYSHENLEAVTIHGNSALMISCYYGCAKAVRLLLRAGASPYARNNSNVNAFEMAVHNNNRKILDLLFEYSSLSASPSGTQQKC